MRFSFFAVVFALTFQTASYASEAQRFQIYDGFEIGSPSENAKLPILIDTKTGRSWILRFSKSDGGFSFYWQAIPNTSLQIETTK